jgi:hypothetical protein
MDVSEGQSVAKAVHRISRYFTFFFLNFYFQTSTTEVPVLIGLYCCNVTCFSRRATTAGKDTFNIKEESAKAKASGFKHKL